MHRTLATLAALATATTPTLAADPVVLQPNGSWNLDYSDEKCLLTRLFGEGKDTHFLAFQQYWPAPEAGVTVAGPGFDRFRSLARTDVRFSETQTPFATTPFTGTVGSYGPGVIFSNLRPDRGEPEQNVTGETVYLPTLDGREFITMVYFPGGSSELQGKNVKVFFESFLFPNSGRSGGVRLEAIEVRRHALTAEMTNF